MIGDEVLDALVYIGILPELLVDCLESALGKSIQVIAPRHDTHSSANCEY